MDNRTKGRFNTFNDDELTVLDLALSYFIDDVRKDFEVIASRAELRMALFRIHEEVIKQKVGYV